MMKLIFDGEMFCPKAIKNAAYDLSGQNIFEFSVNKDRDVIVTIHSTSDANVEASSVTEEEFRQRVLDHQIRLDLINDFGRVRELIVAQAFAPCDEIDEVVKIMKP